MGLRGEKKHPRDERRRQNKTSQRKKQKVKQSYNGIKKDNYKKKDHVVSSVECCICFHKVSNTADNSVKCGKIVHFICGECKFRCNETGNDKCPMCRSHPIRNPIARDVMLPVIQGERLEKPKCPYTELSPKQKRIYNRSYMLTPFNPGSNRIVRERSGTGRSGSPDRSIFNWRQHDPVPFGWLQWMLRGGEVDSINLEGTAVLIGRRYIAGYARSPAQLRRVLRAAGAAGLPALEVGQIDPDGRQHDLRRVLRAFGWRPEDDDDELFNIWDIPIWTRVFVRHPQDG